MGIAAQGAPVQAAPQKTEGAVAPGKTAPQQAAVQVAEYVDEKGNTIAVTTYADGSLAVAVNGHTAVTGHAAEAMLAAHGIALTVSADGLITQQSLGNGVKVKLAPQPAPAAPRGAEKGKKGAQKGADGKAEADGDDAQKAAGESAEGGAEAATAPAAAAAAMPANLTPGSGAQMSVSSSTSQMPADNPSSESNLNEEPISK